MNGVKARHTAAASRDIPRIGITDPLSWYGLLDNVATSLSVLDLKVPGGPWRLFEVADQDFMPSFIREKIQSTLTAQWNRKLPFLQPQPPSTLAATLLSQQLSLLETSSKHLPTASSTASPPKKQASISNLVKRAATNLTFHKTTSPPSTPPQASTGAQPLTVVDFCSGAGGPVPAIEKAVNTLRRKQNLPPLQFLVSDLHPHLDAWINVSGRSDYLSFIPQSVDATAPPRAVINSSRDDNDNINDPLSSASTRIFRTFFLSFHHFDDFMAVKTLKSTLATSDGFAIVELQDRRFSSLLLMYLEFFLVFVVSVFWFYGDVVHLGCVYLVPVLPVVMMWDGMVSCLRTRSFEEVMALVDLAMEEVEGLGGDGHGVDVKGAKVGKREKGALWFLDEKQGSGVKRVERGEWVFEGGRMMHTFPIGYMNWVVGRRQG